MATRWADPTRWMNYVQYRSQCSECGEMRMVAVVPWHGDKIRLCRTCHADGFWRERAREAASHEASRARREA